MIRFFECEFNGDRFVGFDKPAAGEPLRLYPVMRDDVRSALVTAGDPETFVSALTRNKGAVIIAASEKDALHLLAPLLPASPGEAMLSGFMQTHNVKIPDGKPTDTDLPVHPTWFFKGLGSSLRVSGTPLNVPASAISVCEEAEVVLIYIGDTEGTPRYAGYTFGNDLTDIGRFRQNKGHLAYAKLCDASISPWFYFGSPPQSVRGQVTIERNGAEVWNGSFRTGVEALHYRLEDMMEHLFSYPALHQPGLVHYVFIGADRGSFHDGFRIVHGDRLSLDITSHDAVLSNTVQWAGRSTAG